MTFLSYHFELFQLNCLFLLTFYRHRGYSCYHCRELGGCQYESEGVGYNCICVAALGVLRMCLC